MSLTNDRKILNDKFIQAAFNADLDSVKKYLREGANIRSLDFHMRTQMANSFYDPALIKTLKYIDSVDPDNKK